VRVAENAKTTEGKQKNTVKNALAEIIKQYRPDFKLYDIENEIYNKRRNK